MDEMKEEDRTAPISEKQVLDSLSSSLETRLSLLDKLMDELNRKRDAYSGIVSSIKYVIDSKCEEMVEELQSRIVKLLTAYPMRYGGRMFLTKVQARVVSERPIFVEEMYESILETASQWSKSFPNENDILALQIVAVKSIKNAEHQRGGRTSKISQQEFDNLCYKAIQSCDSSIKIDTFSFIFESRSTTKLLTDKEFSLFKVLFQAALGLQEPALRQTFLSVTNRVMKRLKKSHEFVMRDKKLYSPDDKQSITSRYMGFLTWLIEYCFDNTYCNAYFGSFIITVSTLKLIILHITYTDKDLNIEPLLKKKQCYDTLISCLADSFEENKSLALETLLSLPPNEHLFSDETLTSFKKIAYELANSVNPAHSLTCQYMFQLVIAFAYKQQDNILSRNQIIISNSSNLLDLIEECLKMRKNGLDMVETLKHQPNYPKLSCIRVLLQEVDSNKIEHDYQEWCDIVKRILNCSIGSCEDISTIVCNPNPESIGHLPMDLKPVDISDSLSEHDISSEDSKVVTSQMLLISGWKTIKEVSLIFGALCSKFWWPEAPTKPGKCPGRAIKPILTKELIYMILNFFNYYMKRLRHRGAFEQAYGGFTQVTNRLKYDKNMSDYVLQSLNDTLNDFKTENLDSDKAELLRASITRRSGGLPFSIQAKLNLEDNPEAIKSVMDCLFDVIQNPTMDSYKKIHCMNILGALIKQHSQGEKVMPYVGKSFSIAFDAFKSDSYSLRNCANMLLKATIDRTFGVNRLRVDIHRKNQLSFEKFFSECSNLQEQMLRILVNDYTNPSSFAAIHSVFIILFRLCPSLNPKDTFNPEKIILPFIVATRDILFCSTDPRLRATAAELIVRLENFYYDNTETEGTHQHIDENYNKLRTSSSALHGLIMFYKFWIENHAPRVSESVIVQIHKLANDIPLESMSERDPTKVACYDQIAETAMLELIESYAINLPDSPKLIAPIKCSNVDLNYYYCHNLYKRVIFSHILMRIMYVHGRDEGFKLSDDLEEIRKYWVRPEDIGSGVIKLCRQATSESECFIDYILEKFDLDLSAAYVTPYDKLKLNYENDKRREAIAKFCHQPSIAKRIRENENFREMFKLDKYGFENFIPKHVSSTAKAFNTNFLVELLAFGLKNWEAFRLDECLMWPNGGGREIGKKLREATTLLKKLPDCDVRCLILLCAGRHLKFILMDESGYCYDKEASWGFDEFSMLLNQMSDGDSIITIRECCIEVLKMLLIPALKANFIEQNSLVNLLSALIKLSQDEDSSIRRASDILITSLEPDVDSTFQNGLISVTSRLDSLIRILTTKVFNSNTSQDVNECFNLLISIIFNHNKNYTKNLIDEKERLFDKTKLNTFADFVAIIRSTFTGLEEYFSNHIKASKNLIHINLLQFPKEVIEEFKLVDAPKPSSKGDYSWRLTKITNDLANLQTKTQNQPTPSDNQALLKSFIDNIIESLHYFASGYFNVLLDTEYIYHEISLYKRISLVMFLVNCTHHGLEINECVNEMKRKLDELTNKSCCTNLLDKCSKLLK